ncbi:hypothetical protein ACFPT7_07315 [Acidicapsa dinghuensis]|uniref:Uncharacterized protein n=1 Tax=Acidicapsa dinghuensis TaxID=2218256 RepID=A0ABW1EE36_9BACT|nr:hypothetical protein [Acidicapsa dinghuensis]
MQTGTLNDASSQGRELRYVTAHFRDLQGLRMAPFWGALLVLVSLAATSSFSRVHLAWAAAVLTGVQFGWLYLGGRWYEQRYGVVKEPEPAVPSGLISIMHPAARPQGASNPPTPRYGYLSGINAVLLLLWALMFIPGMFLGHRAQPGLFALLLAAYQIFPRCIHPVPYNWSVFLRRILATTALIAMVGIYLEYRFTRIDLWTWMALLLSFLLLLDLYDHWLLNHLLNGDSTEGIHE